MESSHANDVLFFLGMDLLWSTNDFGTKKLNQNHEKQLDLPKEVLKKWLSLFHWQETELKDENVIGITKSATDER